jgi:hypothetical protein
MISQERQYDNESFVIISNNEKDYSHHNISLNDEQIFLEQKKEIERIKLNNQKIQNEKENEKNLQKTQFYLLLTDYQFFESTSFNVTKDSNNNYNSIPEIGEEWKEESQLKEMINSDNSLKLKNLAIRLTNEIDYSLNKMTISLNLILTGESEFWLMTRCFVNENLNDYENENVIENNIFNKYSSVMKIIKEPNSSRCFVHFGTFYEDKKYKEIKFKTFFKRQLINNNNDSKNKNFTYLERDFCEFKIDLVDMGIELIKAKIKMNDCEISNELSANFYLPIHKKAKIVFAGYGNEIEIKNLFLNITPKDDQFFSNETRSCGGCCNIF